LSLSRKGTIQLLQAVKPNNATLFFFTESFVNEMKAAYKFYGVIYKNEQSLMVDEDKTPPNVELVKKLTKSLTRLPYFFGVGGFEEPDFRELNTVIIAVEFSIDRTFLKAWYEYVWPTKALVFRKPVNDLAVFKNFKRTVVSEHLFKVYVPLGEDNCNLESANELGRINKHLQHLKHAFPKLNDVYGTLKFDLLNQGLTQVAAQLTKHVSFLVAQINKKIKPTWAKKFNILMEIACGWDTIEELRLDPAPLMKAVEFCRGLKGAKWASLHGPSHIDYDWNPNRCCFAMIELATEDALFQVPFTTTQHAAS